MNIHFSNLASMYDPNVYELEWENDQIRFRSLTSNTDTKDRVSDLGMIKLDRHDKNKMNSYPNRMQTAGYPEMYPELYEDDDFNVVSRNYDREQIVPINEVERTARDSEVPQSCEANSVPEMSVGNDEKRVNFSIFLRSPSLIKTIYPSSEAAGPTSDINGFKDLNTSTDKEVKATASNMNALLPDSNPRKGSVHVSDQQSEAVGNFSSLPKNHDNGISGEQVVPSSSLSSRGASNCPSYSLKRRYEDNDSSENGTEESEGKREASAARGSKRVKGKRKAEFHKLSERSRRDRINKKMRALKELIPNCNTVDKASMLEDAIEYLRTLQLQVQMMSMGGGVYMPPNLNPMIAMAMQQVFNAQAQQIAGGYFPFGLSVGCNQAQFPTFMPRMFGYQANQGFFMSMPRVPPFESLGLGRFSPPQYSIHASASAAAGVNIPGGGASCVRQSMSRDSNPRND